MSMMGELTYFLCLQIKQSEKGIFISQGKYVNDMLKNFELTSCSVMKTLIGTKWVFRNKLDENGTVTLNKARLVAQGYRQEEGIDYDERFASTSLTSGRKSALIRRSRRVKPKT